MILNSYITKRMIKTTTHITIVVCLTVAMIESLRLLELLVNRSITILQFLTMIFLLLPQYIATILPFAIFASITNTYIALLKNSEISVMRSTGASNTRLLLPSLQVGIMGALLSLALYTTIIPIGWHQFKTMKFNASNAMATKMITPSKFIDIGNSTTIFARKVSGLNIYDIILYKKADNNVQILTAKKGGILSKNDQTQIILYNGVQQSGRSKNASILSFDEYVISVNITLPQYSGKSDIDEFTSIELLEKISNQQATKTESVIFYSRLINSLIPIMVALLAGIAMLINKYNRNHKTSNVLMSSAIMVTIVGIVISLNTNAIGATIYLSYATFILLASISVIIFLSIHSDRKRSK